MVDCSNVFTYSYLELAIDSGCGVGMVGKVKRARGLKIEIYQR